MSLLPFLTTVAAFVLAIGILVTIHELGHYWAARWCDVKILRFSIGFGRPLWMRKVGPDQTEWVIAALPVGGYVKMADERDGSAAPADRARAFNHKTVWQRILIVLAGPDGRLSNKKAPSYSLYSGLRFYTLVTRCFRGDAITFLRVPANPVTCFRFRIFVTFVI